MSAAHQVTPHEATTPVSRGARAPHSLRRRIATAFAAIALFTALLFSGFAVLFLYTVEDEFFENMLTQEAAHQQRSWSERHALAAPLRADVSVHLSQETLPPELRAQLRATPRAREFFGAEGRHYHLRELPLQGAPQPALLVAEVGEELVVRQRLPLILSWLAAALCAIVALTIALGYWLAWRATRPLTQLADVVAHAAPSQLPQGFSANYPSNEIGALANALDEAMSRVSAFIAREQHFTRDASHELRTPLAVIEGAAFLLAQEPLPPQAAQQLQRIRSAATQMGQSVETLLALAREELSAGAEMVALLPLAETTVVQLAHLLDGKAVEVEIAISADTKVRGPRGALAILLANLVGNAFTHTQRGTVRIAFDGAQLTVSDDGPGIAPELREHLFESGVKGHGSTGHGLGLSIAQRLADRLGIALSVSSAPPQRGTIATLRWPP